MLYYRKKSNQVKSLGGSIIQKLYFEPAWDKTIAPQDRINIENVFNEQATLYENHIQFSFLRQATNHKGELLIITLIHNGKAVDLTIRDTIIAYTKKEVKVARGRFTLPQIIPAKTSMPWTFIFSLDNEINQPEEYVIQHQ